MSGVFFAKASDAAVGSFHYSMGLVEFNLSPEARQLMQNLEAIKSDGRDEATLTRLAYEVTSYLHEMRHFADCFGTLAGLSLFAGRLQLMKKFATLCEAVRARDGIWAKPPVAWALDPAGPQEVRDFVRAVQAFDRGQQIYLAPFGPLEVDGHLEALRLEVNVEGGGQVDASPLRVDRVRPDGSKLSRSVLYPLGVEALFEGSAHAIGRNLVEHHFPESVAAAFERRMHVYSATDAQGNRDQRAAQTATPYMVIDLLITRFLRAHGVPTFPRNLVLAAIDRVLATSSIHAQEVAAGKTAMHIDRVGAKLLELLESSDPKDLARGELPPAPEIGKVYAQMLATYEAGGDWPAIADDRSPAASIAIWETYMAKTYVVPLLRARVAGDRAFATYDGFLELVNQIRLPPARVANGTLMLGVMPERVQQAWWHCLMFGELMWQAARTSGALFCPRAHPSMPGIDSMNLALAGDCKAHLKLGCGTHEHGTEPVFAPRCLFEDTLRVMGLKA